MLEGYRCRQEAFSILECLLGGNVYSNVLAPPFRSSVKGFKICAVGQKTAVKVYHAKETLQLYDVVRGWAIFYFSSVISWWGPLLSPKSCVQEIQEKVL